MLSRYGKGARVGASTVIDAIFSKFLSKNLICKFRVKFAEILAWVGCGCGAHATSTCLSRAALPSTGAEARGVRFERYPREAQNMSSGPTATCRACLSSIGFGPCHAGVTAQAPPAPPHASARRLSRFGSSFAPVRKVPAASTVACEHGDGSHWVGGGCCHPKFDFTAALLSGSASQRQSR